MALSPLLSQSDSDDKVTESGSDYCYPVQDLLIVPLPGFPTLRPAVVFRSVLLCVLLILAVVPSKAPAQSSVLDIVSPHPGQQVGSEGLLIVVSVRNGYTIDPRSVELFIDEVDYSDEAKVSPKSIRFLFRSVYGKSLSPGNHVARISARMPDGTDLGNLEWQFVVDGSRRETTGRHAARLGLPIRGTTYIGTRNSDISGNRSLRQEPESIYTIRSDLRAKVGAFTIPLKAYLTTNETNSSQPRNRFLIGAQSKHFTILLGDTNPYFSPLALSNTRTRGVLTEINLKPVRLSFATGQIRRGIEYEQSGDPNVLASPLLSSYKRMLTAARLSIGNPSSARFSLHAMKAVDDTLSVSFGSRPIENIVAGSDFEINIMKGRFGGSAGAAMSLTTEDISRGVSDKAEIDSLFDVSLPIDPSDFRRVITLNTSTVPIRLDKLTSLAWYSKVHAKAVGHTVSAEFRSIGSSFFSAGNPFLINDRKIYTFSDRFRHAGGKVFGVLRFSQYENFDNSAFSVPLDSRTWSANVTVAARTDIPTITLGYRRQDRARGTSDLPLSDSELNSYTLGLSQQLRVAGNRHTLHVLATRSSRSDAVQSQLNNVAFTGSIGVLNQVASNISTSVRYTRVGIRYDNLDDSQIFHTATGDVMYQVVNIPLDLRAGMRYTHAGGSMLVSSSNRYGGSLAAEYELQQNMLIELQVGIDAYRDEVLEEARYTERYVVLRHRYTF